MNMKLPRLVIIEGQDRTGKDTLMWDILHNHLEDVIIYRQETCEEANIDYRDTAAFSAYLFKAFDKTYEDIKKLAEENPTKTIVTSRLWISDTVYSKIFHRVPVIEQIYKDKFVELFGKHNIYLYTMVWLSWSTFKKRMEDINEEESINEYSHEEFLKIKKGFILESYGNASIADVRINRLASYMTREEVYKDFDEFNTIFRTYRNIKQ